MVRINAVFPEETLKKIDAIAKEKNESRSGFLREAAEKSIEEYQKMKAEELRKKRIIHSMKIQDKLRKKSAQWDGVSEIRKWREFRK